MKIGQSLENLSSQASSSTSASQRTAQQGANAAVTAKTSATQSTRSAGVSVTMSTQTAPPGDSADVDTKKVAAVKAAIQDGTYKVNAEAIADNLLSSSQEMLSRRVN
ncbi:MAG: flagellar biosynthesis anti-sigma factor FlgM [Rhodoferax sp.]|nr:flagellar biosynthesis anti-sigma factor FlgM [Rhodoferax sp.]